MINLKETLAQDIAEGLKKAVGAGSLPEIGELPPIVIDRGKDARHGDYACPIALSLVKIAGKKPIEIIEHIVEHMPKKEYIGKIEAAAPGFINIWISERWMESRVDDVLKMDLCIDIRMGEGKLANLEFISANPTGPLTLGNARTAFSADTLANVLTCAGYNVTREYYINDAGNQIRRLGESVVRRILQIQGEEVEYGEDLYQGEYIHAMADVIAERWRENEGKEFTKEDLEDKELIDEVSTEAMELCLAAIKKTIHDDLRIHFDVWTSERGVRKSGLIERSLDALREGGHTYKKDGAEFLQTTKFGDNQDRPLVKKDGEYAYIAPDIGYHQGKFERKFDLIFTFLGADHQGYIPRLKAAMQALGNDAEKLHFMVGQWLGLLRDGKQIKLSKRKGNVYGPKDLIDEIGYDAARFFMVQHALNSHMTLDLDLAQEKSERNPVYYVQYAYVRLQSILRKAKERGLVDSVEEGEETILKGIHLTEPAEFELLRTMFRFPEIITDIARTHEVHRLPYFAYDLARAVQVFYKQAPVLSAGDRNVVQSRLQLVFAVRKVLGETLDILGVGKPNVM